MTDESSPLTQMEVEKGGRSGRYRLSLSTAILASMVLGILTGIFFGELVGFLDVVGSAFIKLLQMTILPYILVSLILGIGGLSYEKAGLLAIKAGGLLLVTWVIVFVFIMLMQIGFPEWESASFFSDSMVEFPPAPDFLNLYIPANPFHSMAENLIPAVVIFALAVGVALIGIGDKKPFLDDLEIIGQALMRVAGMVVKLTPIGVFAISASAAGTMSVDEFAKLQVYLIIFNVACLILTFWVLPMFVAAITPFKYRDVVQVSRDALVTAFTTGNLFVVLPVLTEGSKKLFADYGMQKDNTDAYVDVLIPVSFNFPNIGKLVMLFFILFAGWFAGNEMELSGYPQFIFSGLMSFFGGVDVALPFMLDLMRIPSDMYQLYVVTGIINGRTATLLAAMNLLCFTLLVVSSLTGYLKVVWPRVLMLTVTSLGLLIGSMLLSRVYFETAVSNAYDKDDVVSTMKLVGPLPTDFIVYDVIPKLAPDKHPKAPILDRITARGEIRIGFFDNRLPFTYTNDDAELVGLDIDAMYNLARDLGVKPVFIPLEHDSYAAALTDGTVDLIGTSMVITTETLRQVLFPAPHMDVTAAFLVRDYDRGRFVDMETVRSSEGLTIAVAGDSQSDYFINKMVGDFPNASIMRVDSVDSLFNDDSAFYDAVLVSAEGGSAMTLLHPEFSVVVPRPGTFSVPLGYAVSPDNRRFADFLGGWIEIKKKEGDFQRYYDHWILGQSSEDKQPRWSVIRNVLGWVDW